ncbi:MULTISPECIES: ABC transporter ATP-binding protein [Butyricimonas]|uniref:ABC transporter ATP-binding protein n=1 Tax=Butyricimonas TaxID=574697 RepID=UPI000C080AC5|nr:MULTISPECIES: ABC transporter ATP-binding protein [Butyricimonas]MCB6971332.1 ABC transporter ATP-binding protein [Butyricimonas synergistica]MCG4518046.1 ABC transporter ATP-binding protein [Butyricimonas sp. DFI.6.44]
MPIIETKNLYKTYKDEMSEVHAVDDVNISISEGEFTAIVGPSGSGKTTLLNLIGGLDTPTSGNLYIDGQDISLLKPKEMVDFRLHNIGFVFQSFNLIPVLSAKENVAFVMELQGRKKSERDERAQELLESVGLGDRVNSRPSKLSGGQQQRVAVARALASKPKFILADEPTANLDSKSAENLLDMMEKLNEKENITFVFSTHDPRIMAKARRIITLEDGKIINDIVK